MRRLQLIVAACLLGCSLGLFTCAGAFAESAADVDCDAHAALTHHYAVGELRTALATMPADEREYTPCYQLIQSQLYKELGISGRRPGSGGSGGGGSGAIVVVIVVIVIALGGGGLAYRASRRGAGGGDESPPAAGT